MVQRYKKSGEELEVLNFPINLIIHTKVPNKYLLIDQETNEVYIGDKSGYWTNIGYLHNDQIIVQNGLF